MARTAKKVESTAPSTNKQPTAAEMREWYEKNNIEQMKFAEAENALKNLRDVTKNQTKTVNSFSKETLRTYLKNISSNEKNLRNLSRYLYYRSQPYFRLIHYFGGMFEMGARSIIPDYNLVKENSPDKILKSYQNTLDVMDTIDKALDFEVFKSSIICLREDVFYAACYYDDTGMFWMPLDQDYCKIDSISPNGLYGFSMDVTWFRSRPEVLEYWGEPFQSMYREYESTGVKWVHMDEAYSVCFKARAEDNDIVLPIFSGLFIGIINLLDVEDVQAAIDEQSVTNILQLPLETLSGSKNENDWKISPDVVLQFFDRFMNEALPPYATGVVIPGELKKISLSDADGTNDVNKVQKNTEVLFNTSGGAQILNSSTISGTTAFTAAIKADSDFVLSMLLPQYQAWVNRFLSMQISSPCKVKYFPVSMFTKDDFKKSLLNDAQYGLPTKLAINTLNGYSEKDTLALNYLEESVLGLSDIFVPLNSSHTTSSNESGRPTAEESGTELTSDGEASRDKKDNKK